VIYFGRMPSQSAVQGGDLSSRSNYMGMNGAVTIAIVKDYINVEGRLYLNCYDPSTGERFNRVPIMVPAGDNTERFFRPAVSNDGSNPSPVNPEETGKTTQAVLVRRGRRRAPICVGFVRNSESKTEETEAPVAIESGDRDTGDYAFDHTFRNNGASLIVGSDGSVIISTPESTPENDAKARIQLGANSRLRISTNGVSDDGLVVASKLIEYLRVIEERMDALFNWSVEVSTALNLAPPVKSEPLVDPDNSELVSDVIEVPSNSKNAV